jgi:hypothetical protein
VSRVVNGTEAVATQKKTAITLGQWHDIEIKTKGKQFQVKYGDDALEFAVELGAALPPSQVGFHVPANHAVEFREITVAGEARTPRVSIVSCPAYENGDETTDLLTGSSARFQAGAGISSAERTPSSRRAGSHTEFEWPLVIRRYADGVVANEEGDTFELRMVDAGGGLGRIAKSGTPARNTARSCRRNLRGSAGTHRPISGPQW